ncbi:hypothetical protein PoB_004688400 [Plakobranchus ocellatus]|uniref:Uncharacterized protein n=1 Tax=Plakobranchus ocellatus TaxID=259542 RepID=A0AAV4BND9_9GAST|nr:hypothetical protein PoB_004688400 [Plakobranchus ocellatus]
MDGIRDLEDVELQSPVQADTEQQPQNNEKKTVMGSYYAKMKNTCTTLCMKMANKDTSNLPQIMSKRDLNDVECGSILLFQTSGQYYGVYLGENKYAHLVEKKRKVRDCKKPSRRRSLGQGISWRK